MAAWLLSHHTRVTRLRCDRQVAPGQNGGWEQLPLPEEAIQLAASSPPCSQAIRAKGGSQAQAERFRCCGGSLFAGAAAKPGAAGTRARRCHGRHSAAAGEAARPAAPAASHGAALAGNHGHFAISEKFGLERAHVVTGIRCATMGVNQIADPDLQLLRTVIALLASPYLSAPYYSPSPRVHFVDKFVLFQPYYSGFKASAGNKRSQGS